MCVSLELCVRCCAPSTQGALKGQLPTLMPHSSHLPPLLPSGRHADAITEYTKAINTNPQCAVYYNNRCGVPGGTEYLALCMQGAGGLHISVFYRAMACSPPPLKPYPPLLQGRGVH